MIVLAPVTESVRSYQSTVLRT